MIKKQGLILALIFTVLLQAACTVSADACPAPASDIKLFTNAEDGYCLLYPAEYSTALPNHIVINPAVGPGDVLGDAWASINVESADGLTAAQFADEEIAFAGPGLNIQRTEAKVDGEKAVIVDGLPGQDAMRKVFIVHGDRVYTLTFQPWLANARDLGQPTPLGELYTTIMRTLHFLPPTKALPAPTQPWGPGNLPPSLSFVYPLDGQVLDFEGDYLFKVNNIEGADGYLWSFTQNNVIVWENLRDELGLTAGGTYGISAGGAAHSRFVPGPVEVSVRAVKGDYLAEPIVITIILQPR
jgi:hypothetical protein